MASNQSMRHVLTADTRQPSPLTSAGRFQRSRHSLEAAMLSLRVEAHQHAAGLARSQGARMRRSPSSLALSLYFPLIAGVSEGPSVSVGGHPTAAFTASVITDRKVESARGG